MSATTIIDERVTISDETVRQARNTTVPHNASLVLKSPDGQEHELPSNVQQTLIAALRSIAKDGSAHIGRLPEQLTSTVAADHLGVSRPTLMKWVKDGEIAPFKVGSHNRFHRSDVLALKKKRQAQRREAFNELRALEAERDQFLED